MQKDLFASEASCCLIEQDGRAVVHRQWLDSREAAQLFDRLRQSLAWEQTVISMYGKQVAIPRLNAWCGDVGSSYSYSGAYFDPQPWTPELAELRQRLQVFTQAKFNSVLANCYRNGSDGVAWHSDDEKELGPAPTIASLSLGETRQFTLKHKSQGQTLSVELAAGDLLVMSGSLQANWHHQVPKTRKSVGERINLTFRYVHGAGAGDISSHLPQ